MEKQAALFDHIKRFIKLSEQQEALLASATQYVKLDRKAFLLNEFQVCNAYYFVLSGCLRFYRNTESGTEQILQFGIPGWWLSDFQSFETQMPSEYNIQAIQQTEVLILNRSNASLVFEQIPELNFYFRKMMQRAYTASLKKIELILCESAEDRFLRFTNTFPGFVQSVPQYMVASFLGITPQFLSMLRAKNK